MWLSVLIAFLGMTGPASLDRETAIIEACRTWSRSSDNQSQPVRQIASDGLCFSGPINDETSAAFVSALSKFEPSAPVVVVVNSGGGEINAGMAMGEVLIPRQTTVVAQKVCASSCANYLFTAGDRRVIDDDALLLFHGGAHRLDEAQLREAIAAQVAAEQVEAQVAGVRAGVQKQIDRQDAFLRRAGVDVNFFRWMAGFNDLSEDGRLALCPTPDPVMILYSDRLLATHGVTVDASRGPRSQAALDAAVRTLGRSDAVCFMR